MFPNGVIAIVASLFSLESMAALLFRWPFFGAIAINVSKLGPMRKRLAETKALVSFSEVNARM